MAVNFFGEAFELPERMNDRRLLQLFAAAQANTDSESAKGAAALDKLLNQVIRDEDQDRFENLCDRERTSSEELMEFVGRMLAARADRPTVPARDSSVGPSLTEEKSTLDSSPTGGSETAMTMLAGRPDLQLMVLNRQEAEAAAV